LLLLRLALVVAVRSSRSPRRKAREGLGGSGRIDLGQPVRCLGAGVGVKRVVGDDAAQGLGSPGRIDLGQPVRCLGAGVGVNASSATMLRKASAPRAGSTSASLSA
jgi:hypothetical protein